MSDGEETSEAHAQPEPQPEPQPTGGAVSSRLPLVALLVAVVAVALSIWALTSASSNSSNSATAKLPGDPKARVCTAFNTVAQAVQLQTNSDLGPDPVARVAVAGNARLALIGGGQYLQSQLDAATPPELADPVRTFANELQTIGMAALTGAVNTDPEQANRMTQADITRKQISDMCK